MGLNFIDQESSDLYDGVINDFEESQRQNYERAHKAWIDQLRRNDALAFTKPNLGDDFSGTVIDGECERVEEKSALPKNTDS